VTTRPVFYETVQVLGGSCLVLVNYSLVLDIRVRAGKVLGVQKYFARISPILAETVYGTTFSLEIFCSCCYIIFSSAKLP